MDYLSLFEKLTDLMTDLNGYNVPEVFETLGQLCKILNISKGENTFYKTLRHEMMGDGETYVAYDSGEKHHLISHQRFVTPAQMVVTSDVYQAEGAEPLTELQKKRVETIQRMTLTYLNRARQEDVIQWLMYWDDDGFHNLRYFYSQIMRLKETGQLANKTAIRINLKHFGLVNEQVGKDAGDIVMKNYCQALVKAFHGNDALCRLGGDNFIAIFDTEYLPAVLDCLNGTLVPYDEDGAHRVEVAAVAGVYTITNAEEIQGPGQIMEPILTAYLIAKRDSTANIVFYNEEFRRMKNREIKIQRRFEKALQMGEFLVYYQPKVDIQTRNLIGAEALCRWMHKGKIIPPMEFIPALERGTDICRLDFYMLDHVCKDIRRWLDEGRNVVRVSVNLSRRHMMDPDLFDHILEIVDGNNVPHEYIEIELTETTTDVEFRDLKRIVKGLQDVGIHTSVDDFGVGYSSLNLIKEIPWDVLKLDKSILPANGEDVERGSRMFAHIIAMAHEIGLKCVAEGVETEEQLDIMRHYGCRIAQGFLFDRPLPVAEFEKRMDSGTYQNQ